MLRTDAYIYEMLLVETMIYYNLAMIAGKTALHHRARIQTRNLG